MDDGTRLALLPVSAVALALGVCIGRPQNSDTAGRLSALVDELKRRGVYTDLLASLDPQLAASIGMLEQADRGQVWARMGRH